MPRLLAFTLSLLVACGPGCTRKDDDGGPGVAVPAPEAIEMRFTGDRRRIIKAGDLRPTTELAFLKSEDGKANWYAIGPVEGLQGEVTIYDGRPSIATVGEDGEPVVEETFDRQAIFLAAGRTPEWVAVPVSEPVGSLEELEAFVGAAAEEAGLDTARPLMFRVEATPPKLVYHIIWKTGDAPHDHDEHKKSKVKFSLAGEPVRIVGLWIDEARVGAFTHPGKRTHLHFQTEENTTSGHIDALELPDEWTLYLPKAFGT